MTLTKNIWKRSSYSPLNLRNLKLLLSIKCCWKPYPPLPTWGWVSQKPRLWWGSSCKRKPKFWDLIHQIFNTVSNLGRESIKRSQVQAAISRLGQNDLYMRVLTCFSPDAAKRSIPISAPLPVCHHDSRRCRQAYDTEPSNDKHRYHYDQSTGEEIYSSSRLQWDLEIVNLWTARLGSNSPIHASDR